MPSFRFVHAADLHLDSPFRGMARLSPDAADALVEATFTAFDHIVELCRREQVDALLVAGDVYDSTERSPRAEWRFHRRLAELGAEGIQCMVVHGNHDPLGEPLDPGHLPPNVHVFGPDVESVPLRHGGDERVIVYGMSFPERDVTENLVRRFQRHPGVSYAIGLLHANVGGRPGHEAYAPCSIDDLVAAGMDYWALGHVHEREIVRPEGPAIVYPGNPQGLNRREPGARGCHLVTVEHGQATIEFMPTDVVRWQGLRVPIDGIEDRVALGRTLEARIRESMEAADGRSMLLRLELTGRGALHRDVSSPGATQALVEDIEREVSDGDRFVLVESLTITTQPPVDRARLMSEPSLSGEILRIAREIGERGGAEMNEARDVLDELGKRLREAGVGFDPGEDELAEWVNRAAMLAVDLLDEGDR